MSHDRRRNPCPRTFSHHSVPGNLVILKDAGVCEEVVRHLQGEIPILGVCLGHQGICEVYGCTISHAKQLMHGKKSRIHIDNNSPIFKGLDEEMDAARYHSLVAVRETVPDVLQVIGEDKNGEVMAVQHKRTRYMDCSSIQNPFSHRRDASFLKTF